MPTELDHIAASNQDHSCDDVRFLRRTARRQIRSTISYQLAALSIPAVDWGETMTDAMLSIELARVT